MLVLGAGKMAKAIAYDFVRQDDVTEVVIASRKRTSVTPILKFLKSKKAKFVPLDVTKHKDVVKLMKKFDVAVSAVPYVFNYELAKAAVQAGCNFVDLGGNNTIVKKEFGLEPYVELLIDERKDVLTVPAEAVISRDRKTFLKKADGTEVEVTVGLNTGLDAEITDGIKEGDQILVPLLKAEEPGWMRRRRR